MIRCSLHNHTRFVDGANTPKEMADAAYEAGLSVFGISEHSVCPYEPESGVKEEEIPRYIEEMEACRKTYHGRMEVLCGLEQDFYSPVPDHAYDYVIGSVHYVDHEGILYSVDSDARSVQEQIRNVYHCDGLVYAEEYFATVAQVADRTDCDIIGHFDLCTKFNENNRLYDMTCRRYRQAAMQALESLLPKEIPFEINSGAIARGYRSQPYPAAWILKELHAHGARIIITSDAHQKENICFGFELAEELALSCGFRTVTVLENGIWQERPIGEE